MTVSNRTKVKRLKEKGQYDRETAYAILDEGLVCHVGIAKDEQPVVIPMLYARDGDRVLIHGSIASRLIKTLADGNPVCIELTLLDGLVLARSVFNHSANYRSIVIYGKATPIRDPDEKNAAFEILVEKMVPGRSADARMPNKKEISATEILAVPIEEFSVKISAGDPDDYKKDMKLPVWAGVIPIEQQFGKPRPAADILDGIELPDYVADYPRPEKA